MKKSDWVRQGGIRIYQTDSHVYMAVRDKGSPEVKRFHAYAVPRSGMPIPVRIGASLSLKETCKAVGRHAETHAQDKGDGGAALLAYFPPMVGDMQFVRELHDTWLP